MMVERTSACCPLAGLVFMTSEMGDVGQAGGVEPKDVK